MEIRKEPWILGRNGKRKFDPGEPHVWKYISKVYSSFASLLGKKREKSI